MTTTPPELTALRGTIDDVDAQIVALLAQRFAATDQVGRLKAAGGLQAVDEVRERQQQQRFSELAMRHGLDDALVQRLFRLVIDEVVGRHRRTAQQQAAR